MAPILADRADGGSTMSMDQVGQLMHADLSDVILNAFYKVYNTLGYGFLEKVYENALAVELRKRGLVVLQQVPINVYYEGVVVGEYVADMLVNDRIIIETKCATAIAHEHEAQLLNYLRATAIEVGLLLNFGPKPEFSRKVYQTARKKGLSLNSQSNQR
jgi:GxxExxY protein